MADTEQPDVPAEPQSRHIIYCGGAFLDTLSPHPLAARKSFAQLTSFLVPRSSLHAASRGVNHPPGSLASARSLCATRPQEADQYPSSGLQYCEYGGTVRKCQEWLESHHKEMYDRIWSAEALEAATASLSVEAQKRAAKDAQKKTAKAEAAEAKQADKLAKSVVTIKRIERNKKKFVTAVIGLEAFGLELKKVAKDLGKKFATGSSVTKVPSGGEEIVVQGDVSEEVEEFLLEKYKEIPEDNIELVDDKKKKKAAAA
ncbi:density-regulated protein DRP1 [Purpureocillium lilacinum]|uniref:Translation machinery-associated protein 22 n=1 Tax=Purpureocillium lilacinum TaxID=33203 RepID=A0A179GX71_PURLI|nr:density-regulated protein DRP1 [Purpureocillium lilacinum]OAQ81729.1 density-regulated protein DRP1 [Purpureocillium lilacinum]OAQ91776.1 density-regulated protein DRP1 [Purpureocillium lilacinum]GJN73107.1 translation machinery-associated protein 22 [Purpureocillium lilacinum]GJN83624.1 translation machinery-associated protein 22 [Purpureocillium lilacinum]